MVGWATASRAASAVMRQGPWSRRAARTDVDVLLSSANVARSTVDQIRVIRSSRSSARS